MGDIPPRTFGSPGRSAAIACDADLVIAPNIRHSLSISKSQCDRLLGSFHSMTASIMGNIAAIEGPVPSGVICEISVRREDVENHQVAAAGIGILRAAFDAYQVTQKENEMKTYEANNKMANFLGW